MEIKINEHIIVRSTDENLLEEMTEKTRSSLKALMEFLPADSSMVVHLTRSGSIVGIEILVAYPNGHFYSFGNGKTTDAALGKARAAMKKKIEDWRSCRFSEKSLGPMNVVVVDDEPESVQLLLRSLKAEGCHVVLVRDSSKAHQKILTGQTDLVILDWYMPESLGGADTLADMDRNIDKLAGPALKLSLKIPLVVYSGLESAEISVPQSRNFQLLEILKKGVSMEELKQSMRQVLMKLPHFDVGTPVGL